MAQSNSVVYSHSARLTVAALLALLATLDASAQPSGKEASGAPSGAPKTQQDKAGAAQNGAGGQPSSASGRPSAGASSQPYEAGNARQPAAGQAAPPAQPTPGQGTVKGSTANPVPDGKTPGGQAGSAGHKAGAGR